MEAGGHRAGEPTRELDESTDPAAKPFGERIKVIGGLVAVGIGVLAVTLITIVALIDGGENAATIASASSGVIASMVGAFFGVKVGTDQSRKASEGEREQAAKATVFAAHLQPQDAREVLALADSVVRGDVAPPATSGAGHRSPPGS